MKTLYFTVYDLAAQLYLEPFTARTIEEAIRNFGAACKTPDHQFAKFPEDYVMYQIGTWDAVSGEVEGTQMQKIAAALDYSASFGNQLELEEGGA